MIVRNKGTTVSGYIVSFFFKQLNNVVLVVSMQDNPENVIRLAGVLLICAATSVLFVKLSKTPTTAVDIGMSVAGY